MFKGFTTKEGKTVYINTDNIIAILDNMTIYGRGGKDNTYISNIYLSSGCNINVLGRAEDILEFIEG